MQKSQHHLSSSQESRHPKEPGLSLGENAQHGPCLRRRLKGEGQRVKVRTRPARMKTHTCFLLILKDSSKGKCESTGSFLGERPGKAWLEETGLRLLSGIIWLR